MPILSYEVINGIIETIAHSIRRSVIIQLGKSKNNLQLFL
ncbi:hypothetical protein Cs308_0907 [Candidatus Chlamydia sanziniae]|uniref:Uncharacterized protein n=1 Tax=Candidatus Chlamydia sanziniae TaxID=1806891 RepID=A0A1A9HWK8_9CHLA|nr:hypothetical protein Cs308_0907 [Candidatus Chlamydia sanziniae]